MKRLFDSILTALALFLLSFPLLFVSLLVLCKIGRPIFFKQSRLGLHGQPFIILKFRTMTNECDQHGCLLPDSFRLTRFGRYLRSTSLDELPSLWNVLIGDMSLVGPRPLLLEYFPLYTPEQARRHDVKAGLTGWAQINGRNAISWEEKFRLDVWYVDNQSFWLDLRILVITIWKVLRRKGISAAGEATMAPFTGSTPARTL